MGTIIGTDSTHYDAGSVGQGAFNGLITADWTASTSTGWLKAQCSSAYVATAYAITPSIFSAARAPRDWTFEGSNDDSSWTTLDTRTSQTGWGNTLQVPKSYTFSNSTAYLYYRLNVSANNGDGFVTVNELNFGFLRPVIIGCTASSSYSTAAPHMLVDAAIPAGSTWVTNGVPAAWWKIQFASAQLLQPSYTMWPETYSAHRGPKDWTWAGSNDDSAWTTLDTQTGITGWVISPQTAKTFTYSNSTPYLYYRLDITAQQGSSPDNYLSLNELDIGIFSYYSSVQAALSRPKRQSRFVAVNR